MAWKTLFKTIAMGREIELNSKYNRESGDVNQWLGDGVYRKLLRGTWLGIKGFGRGT